MLNNNHYFPFHKVGELKWYRWVTHWYTMKATFYHDRRTKTQRGRFTLITNSCPWVLPAERDLGARRCLYSSFVYGVGWGGGHGFCFRKCVLGWWMVWRRGLEGKSVHTRTHEHTPVVATGLMFVPIGWISRKFGWVARLMFWRLAS